MAKIAFLGAGSLSFGPRVATDILSCPSLRTCELHLVDPLEERVERTAHIARGLVAEHGLSARISASTTAEAALDGADYVITSIRVGGQYESLDIDVPLEVGGVRQTVADTLGIGGIMKGLRTIPAMLDIARQMERRCPGALLLNFANPMPMIQWALAEGTGITSVGLCHGTLSRSRWLADWLGVDYDRLHWRAAGINHMVWFTELSVDGQDMYPRLRELARDPEVAEHDRVGFEMVRQFGHYVAVGSGHCEEYVPYFLPHESEIERLSVDWADDEWRRHRAANRQAHEERLLSSTELPPLRRSEEYAANILHGIESGEPQSIYGNVPNTGLVPNLLEGCCVEVPVLVDRFGLHPCYAGPLPPQLAALCSSNVAVQALVVKAVLEGDREAAIQAAIVDPNTAATMTLPQIRETMERLLDAQADSLPQWS